MQIEKIEIGKLKAAEYNPRKDLKPGDPEFEKLKRSIEEFGYVEPVIVNKRTGYRIVGGHQRYKVLKQLGYTEVDCVIVDLDEQKEKALNIALNKISGSWDFKIDGGELCRPYGHRPSVQCQLSKCNTISSKRRTWKRQNDVGNNKR